MQGLERALDNIKAVRTQAAAAQSARLPQLKGLALG